MALRNAAHFYGGSGFDELNESIYSTSTSITSTSMSIAPASSSPVFFQSVQPKNGPNGQNLSNNPEFEDIFGSDVYFPPRPNAYTAFNNEPNNSNVFGNSNQNPASQNQSNQSPLINRRNPPNVQSGTPTRSALSSNLNHMNLLTSGSATKRQRTSAVWDYFNESTSGTAMTICKDCGAEIQRVRGNTSSMIKHLKTHNITFLMHKKRTWRLKVFVI
jgi:hypothetical protein